MRAIFTILFVFPLLLSSCAATRKNPFLSQTPDAKIHKKDFASLEKLAAKLWEQRQDRASVLKFIEIMKSLVNTPGRTRAQLVQLARAEALVGEYFAAGPSERAARFLAAANRAEVALHLNPAYLDAISVPRSTPEDWVSALEPKDADALLWFAEGLYRWSVEAGPETELKHRRSVKACFDRLETLSPGHHFAAVDRHFGIEHARAMSGDPEQAPFARARFEAALKKGGGFYGNPYAFALRYARPLGEDALLRSLLKPLSDKAPIGPKEILPEQLLEQRRAKSLLAEGMNP
jgi:hypothetical protein